MKNFFNKIKALVLKEKPIQVKVVVFNQSSFSAGFSNLILVLASLLEKNKLLLDNKKNAFNLIKQVSEKDNIYSVKIEFFSEIIFKEFINYLQTTKE